MTEADALEYLGMLWVCFTAGWLQGFLLLTAKKGTEKLL